MDLPQCPILRRPLIAAARFVQKIPRQSSASEPGMSFAGELQRNRNLRRAFLRAVVVAGGLFFAIKFIYDYVHEYGCSFTPLLHGQVRLWSLFGWSARDAAIGAVGAWFAVYMAWKYEGAFKNATEDSGKHENPG